MVAVQHTSNYTPTRVAAEADLQRPQESTVSSARKQPRSLLASLLAIIEPSNICALAGFLLVYAVPYYFFAKQFWSWWTQFSDLQVFVGGSMAVLLGTVGVQLGIMTLIDLGYGPKSFERYRIQPNEHSKPEWYYKTLPVGAFNLLVLAPLAFFVAYLIVTYSQGRQVTSEPLPSLGKAMLGALKSAIMLEILFYYGHRTAHHPRLYKYFHKVHHDFTAPIPVATFHMHPVDFIMNNALPVLAGPVLFQQHIMAVWLWVAIMLVIEIHLHCGLELPFIPTPMDHDYHHETTDSCYGIFGFLDAFHGTRGDYETYRANWRPKDPVKSSD
jgi:methylsterol monooxygenase